VEVLVKKYGPQYPEEEMELAVTWKKIQRTSLRLTTYLTEWENEDSLGHMLKKRKLGC
jgi:hypothetical protein